MVRTSILAEFVKSVRGLKTDPPWPATQILYFKAFILRILRCFLQPL